MKGCFHIIRWIFVLLAVGGAGGGAYVYSVWSEQEQLLRETVLSHIGQSLPGWDVGLVRARFDWNRRVHLYDFSVRPEGETEPLLRIPEVVVTIDLDRFRDDQSLSLREIELLGPQVQLTRFADGRWNFQRPTMLEQSGGVVPDLRIRDGNALIRIEHQDAAPASVELNRVNLEMLSTGMRRLQFKGQLEIARAGILNLHGTWGLDAGQWAVNGQMVDVSANRDLIEIVSSLSPELQATLRKFDNRLHALFHKTPVVHASDGSAVQKSTSAERLVGPEHRVLESGVNDVPPRTLNAEPEPDPQGVPSLGIAGLMDINFRMQRHPDVAAADYKVLLTLKQSQFSHPELPLPLHDIVGKVYWDGTQLLVRDVSARNGVTRLGMDVSIDKSSKEPGELQLRIQDLMLDQRLYDCLPASWQKFYRSLQPAGMVDVSGRLRFDGASVWHPENFVITAKGCSAVHDRFPYPIQAIRGAIRQVADQRDLTFELRGNLGHSVLLISGKTRQAGPEAETTVELVTRGLPIDDRFLAACSEPVRNVLRSLRLKCLADIRLNLFRPFGPKQPFQQTLLAELSEGEFQSVHFPLRLSQLAGQISYTSRDRVWLFSDLKARNEDAQFEGVGVYSLASKPGQLDMTITAKGARFDKQLELALPAHMQQLWDVLSPGGRCHLLAKLHWTPGNQPVVALPALRVFGGSLQLKDFPLPLTDIDARLSYEQGVVQIKQLRARHEEMQVRARGVAAHGADQWRVRFDELFVDDLVPDRVFRLALPDGLRSAVEQLNPRGKLSLSGAVEIRGSSLADSALTSAWNTKVVFSGGQLFAGLDLKRIRGHVTAQGQWDGRTLENRGEIRLDSLEVLQHQINSVRGPYHLRDGELTVGSQRVLQPNPPAVPDSERLIATAIGGNLTLDSFAVLGDSPSYHLIATIAAGRLEDYARRYLPGSGNLHGVINGWIDLHGGGDSAQAPVADDDFDSISGRGQLQISPAALYELPVLVQVFRVLSFVPTDKTAFTYALLDFTVDRGAFWFKSIDLVGDTISLRGKGQARFDGKLALDFYSMLGRNRPRIPVFNILVDEATRGWVGVEVGGTVSAPRARTKALPTIDETLRRFLGAFDTIRRPPIPRVRRAPQPPRLPSP